MIGDIFRETYHGVKDRMSAYAQESYEEDQPSVDAERIVNGMVQSVADDERVDVDVYAEPVSYDAVVSAVDGESGAAWFGTFDAGDADELSRLLSEESLMELERQFGSGKVDGLTETVREQYPDGGDYLRGRLHEQVQESWRLTASEMDWEMYMVYSMHDAPVFTQVMPGENPFTEDTFIWSAMAE